MDTPTRRPAYYSEGSAVYFHQAKRILHGTVQAVAWDARRETYAYTVAVVDGPFDLIRVYETDLRQDTTKKER